MPIAPKTMISLDLLYGHLLIFDAEGTKFAAFAEDYWMDLYEVVAPHDRVIAFNDLQLPEIALAGLVGSKGCDLVDHPVFAAGTRLGDATIVHMSNINLTIDVDHDNCGNIECTMRETVVVFDRSVRPTQTPEGWDYGC